MFADSAKTIQHTVNKVLLVLVEQVQPATTWSHVRQRLGRMTCMCYLAVLETAHNAARCLPIHADVVPLLIRGLGCYTSRVDVRLVYHITHGSSCAPKAGIFSTDALYINHGIRTVVSPCSVGRRPRLRYGARARTHFF